MIALSRNQHKAHRRNKSVYDCTYDHVWPHLFCPILCACALSQTASGQVLLTTQGALVPKLIATGQSFKVSVDFYFPLKPIHTPPKSGEKAFPTFCCITTVPCFSLALDHRCKCKCKTKPSPSCSLQGAATATWVKWIASPLLRNG